MTTTTAPTMMITLREEEEEAEGADVVEDTDYREEKLAGTGTAVDPDTALSGRTLHWRPALMRTTLRSTNSRHHRHPILLLTRKLAIITPNRLEVQVLDRQC